MILSERWCWWSVNNTGILLIPTITMRPERQNSVGKKCPFPQSEEQSTTTCPTSFQKSELLHHQLSLNLRKWVISHHFLFIRPYRAGLFDPFYFQLNPWTTRLCLTVSSLVLASFNARSISINASSILIGKGSSGTASARTGQALLGATIGF